MSPQGDKWRVTDEIKYNHALQNSRPYLREAYACLDRYFDGPVSEWVEDLGTASDRAPYVRRRMFAGFAGVDEF